MTAVTRWTGDATRNAGYRSTHDPSAAPAEQFVAAPRGGAIILPLPLRRAAYAYVGSGGLRTAGEATTGFGNRDAVARADEWLFLIAG